MNTLLDPVSGDTLSRLLGGVMMLVFPTGWLPILGIMTGDGMVSSKLLEVITNAELNLVLLLAFPMFEDQKQFILNFIN